MRPPKAEAVCPLICEDIRAEASGRLSLMGVFGPSILVPSLPATLPGLCAILLVRNPEEPLTAFTISITDPAGNEILPPTSYEIQTPPQERFVHQFQLKIVPFPASAEGDIKFRFTFNGGDEIGLETSLTVKKGPASDRGSESASPATHP